MKSITNLFISRFINKESNYLLLRNEFSLGGRSTSIFDFDSVDNKYETIDSYKYFEKEDSNKYNLIVAELPLHLKSVKNKDFKLSIDQDWELIYLLTKRLSDKGLLIVNTTPSFGTSFGSRRFLNDLKDKGIFLRALIETQKGVLMPVSELQPNIAIFSKKNNDNKLFIASLDETDNDEDIFNNFLKYKANDNLIEGDIINDNFKGFSNYRINKIIENLQTEYKEFEKKYLKDISLGIARTDTIYKEEGGKYIYIPKIGNLNVFCDLDKLDKKPHNFYQVKINEQIVKSKYLECYFKSDIGQLSLKSLFTDSVIPMIHGIELENLIIPIPPIKTQEEIIFSYNLIDSVTTVINNFKNGLSLNPKNAKKISQKLTDTLEVLNELSKSDKILSYIRQGENLKIEYKQTFSVDIKTGKKEKYIEDSSLKNIVGFLNKNGGVLLIGVFDNSEIYGIENDSYESDDKYLLHFKDRIKTSIGEEYFDLINYEIVDVNNKKVLFVECKPSNKPVYMDGNDFYVRSNPATDKLEGPKLVEYINSHFGKNFK